METIKLRTYAVYGLLLGACNTPIELGNRDAQGGSDLGIGGGATGGQTALSTGAGGQRPLDAGLGGQPPIAFCGNGLLESSELCDDGNTVGGDGCSADCAFIEAGWVCTQPGAPCSTVSTGFCGNGLVENGEQCDLGAQNGAAGSACTKDCRWKPTSCGDGIVDPAEGELCDDGVNDGGYGRCAPNCQLGARCGDGVKNGPEECDNGQSGNTGSYGGCMPSCQLASYCGDGTLDSAAGEECDYGPSNGHGACSLTCMLGLQNSCGNGLVEVGEECDLGFSHNDGSYGGCTPDCKLTPSTLGAYCGDGIVNGSEQCDEGSLNGSVGSNCTALCVLLGASG